MIGKKLEALFPKASPLAIDLLSKLLVFNPNKRITIDEALAHPYLQALHCPTDEPVTESVCLEDFEFERHNLTL